MAALNKEIQDVHFQASQSADAEEINGGVVKNKLLPNFLGDDPMNGAVVETKTLNDGFISDISSEPFLDSEETVAGSPGRLTFEGNFEDYTTPLGKGSLATPILGNSGEAGDTEPGICEGESNKQVCENYLTSTKEVQCTEENIDMEMNNATDGILDFENDLKDDSGPENDSNGTSDAEHEGEMGADGVKGQVDEMALDKNEIVNDKTVPEEVDEVDHENKKQTIYADISDDEMNKGKEIVNEEDVCGGESVSKEDIEDGEGLENVKASVADLASSDEDDEPIANVKKRLEEEAKTETESPTSEESKPEQIYPDKMPCNSESATFQKEYPGEMDNVPAVKDGGRNSEPEPENPSPKGSAAMPNGPSNDDSLCRKVQKCFVHLTRLTDAHCKEAKIASISCSIQHPSFRRCYIRLSRLAQAFGALSQSKCFVRLDRLPSYMIPPSMANNSKKELENGKNEPRIKTAGKKKVKRIPEGPSHCFRPKRNKTRRYIQDCE